MTATITRRRAAIGAIAGTLLALTAMATAATARSAHEATAPDAFHPGYCEVLAVPGTAGLQLKAMFNADGPVSGRYGFSVNGGAGASRTAISQGGGFTAQGEGPITLSTATVNENGSYEVKLTVDFDGKSQTCGGHLSPAS